MAIKKNKKSIKYQDLNTCDLCGSPSVSLTTGRLGQEICDECLAGLQADDIREDSYGREKETEEEG